MIAPRALPPCCWISTARYTLPLNATTREKWRLLARLDAPMYVIGFANGLRPRRGRDVAAFFLAPAPRWTTLRYAVFGAAALLWTAWLVAWHRVRVIVAQSAAEAAIGAIVKRAAALLGIRVALVLESHGEIDIGSQFYGEVGGIAATARARLSQFGLRHADAFRAISSSTERELRQLRPDVPLVRFITWTDITVFTSARRSIPVGMSNDILFAAVLVPGKELHTLVAAFARMAARFVSARLVIAGAAQDPSYVARVREQIAEAGLLDRVVFLGALPQRELAARMAAARVLVLPSKSEGLGRVILEAMACGTPAIGTRVGGIPDLIEEGKTGYLVPVGDTAALAQALVQVFSDPQFEAMGQRARRFAEEFFSPADYLSGYRQLLENALGAGGPHQALEGRPWA